MKQFFAQFRAGRRLAPASFAFAAVALAASACTSSDTANHSAATRAEQANASRPKVSVTAQTGAPQPSPPRQTAGNLQVLSPEVLNAEIQDVRGGTFRLADFKDKVVLLNLWATWCGPCRQEIPHLVALNKEYKGKGVEIIGLTNENPATDAEKVESFAEQFKIDYKLGWADASLARALMQGNYSIPQSFVIAPGGRIQTRFRGFSPRLPEMIRSAIDQATEQAKKD